jgi:ankyrin repeat protein
MFTIDQLLIFAVRGRKIGLVRERLAAGGDPIYYEAALGSALLTAIRTRQVEIIHLLMRNGADISQTDERGYGALEYALRTGDVGSAPRRWSQST